jgi:hypothetical protein
MSGPDPRKVHATRQTLRKHRAARKPKPRGARVMRTQGLSRKLAATLAGAVGAQLVAFAVNWIQSGQFDRVELAQLVGVAGTVALGTITGYLAQPDRRP